MGEPLSQGTRGCSLALLPPVAQGHLGPPQGCREHAVPVGGKGAVGAVETWAADSARGGLPPK